MYGLEKRGAKVMIAGRTRARAQVLADTFKARAVDWAARHNAEVDIVSILPKEKRLKKNARGCLTAKNMRVSRQKKRAD